MKAFKYIIFLGVISLLFACSDSNENDNDQAQLDNFESTVCPNQGVTGGTAIYWDSAHGAATPLTQIPSLINPGDFYLHETYPALGFQMPQGYTADDIVNQQTGALGVLMRRDDGNVFWKYVPTETYNGNINPIEIINFEFAQTKIAHNFDPNVQGQLICAETATTNEFGFPMTFASRLIRFGDFTALLIVQTHYMQGLDRTFVSVTKASGTTAEFGNLALNDFLPIHWQLMYVSDDVRDSDLDGTPDNQDSAPFNPDIQ